MCPAVLKEPSCAKHHTIIIIYLLCTVFTWNFSTVHSVANRWVPLIAEFARFNIIINNMSPCSNTYTVASQYISPCIIVITYVRGLKSATVDHPNTIFYNIMAHVNEIRKIEVHIVSLQRVFINRYYYYKYLRNR